MINKIKRHFSLKRIKMSKAYYIREMLYVHTWKRTQVIKVLVYLLLALSLIILSTMSQIASWNKHEGKPASRFKTDIKYVLLWGLTAENNRYLNGQHEFINQNCSFVNCFLTYNRSLLNDDIKNFDSIVFDIHSLLHLRNRDISIPRTLNQKYIFHSLTSASEWPICSSKFENFFNWTWTYKLNSDIPHAYFKIFDMNHKFIGPKTNIIWKQFKNTVKNKVDTQSKSKAVAWISYKCKCKSGNSKYVNSLRRELRSYNYSIDVFGPCGNNKCPNQKLSECYKIIEKQYFFSLVVEDSDDEDLVTEKLLRTLHYKSIPIVIGGANYSRFLPPGSYLDGRNFNLKKLGAVIHYLVQDLSVYEYFFDWHNFFYYKEIPRNYVCDLCSKLNDESFNRFSSYQYFRHWWNNNYRNGCYMR